MISFRIFLGRSEILNSKEIELIEVVRDISYKSSVV